MQMLVVRHKRRQWDAALGKERRGKERRLPIGIH